MARCEAQKMAQKCRRVDALMIALRACAAAAQRFSAARVAREAMFKRRCHHVRHRPDDRQHVRYDYVTSVMRQSARHDCHAITTTPRYECADRGAACVRSECERLC